MKIKQWFTAFLVVALTVAWCPCAMAQGKGGGKGKGGDSAEYTIVTLDERPGDHPGWVRDVVKIGDDWYCPGLMDEKVGNQIVDSWAVVWQVSPSGSSYTVTTHELAAGDFAAAMNEWGEIIGSNGFSGLYWSSLTATPLVLPPLASGSVTEPYGINADGVIVGESDNFPVAWRATAGGVGQPLVLASEPGRVDAVNDCNESGVAQAVGSVDGLGVVSWELQLSNGGLVVVSGPHPMGSGLLQVFGINNFGDSCGRAWGLDPRQQHSQAYRQYALPDGTIEPLSTPRTARSRPSDINDNRQVVGTVETFGAHRTLYGALWEADGKRVDLNKHLPRNTAWHLIWYATAIDSEGTIAAVGGLDMAGTIAQRAMLMIKQ